MWKQSVESVDARRELQAPGKEDLPLPEVKLEASAAQLKGPNNINNTH